MAAAPEQPLRQSIVRLDGVPVWAWQETPKERLEAAYFAELYRQVCEEIEKGKYAISLKGGSSEADYYPQLCEELKKIGASDQQRLPQLFCQLMRMFPRSLLHGPPAVKLSVYLLGQAYQNLRPLRILKPESIENLAAQLEAIEPTMTKTRAREIAAQLHGVKPETAATYRKRHNRRLRKK